MVSLILVISLKVQQNHGQTAHPKDREVMSDGVVIILTTTTAKNGLIKKTGTEGINRIAIIDLIANKTKKIKIRIMVGSGNGTIRMEINREEITVGIIDNQMRDETLTEMVPISIIITMSITIATSLIIDMIKKATKIGIIAKVSGVTIMIGMTQIRAIIGTKIGITIKIKETVQGTTTIEAISINNPKKEEPILLMHGTKINQVIRNLKVKIKIERGMTKMVEVINDSTKIMEIIIALKTITSGLEIIRIKIRLIIFQKEGII